MSKIILLCFALLISVVPALAQPADDWENLTHIRPGRTITVVKRNLAQITGDLVTATDSSVTVRSGGTEQTIPRPDVLRLSVREGKKRVRNLLIGLAAGAGGGAAIGPVFARNSFSSKDKRFIIGITTLFGLGIGGGVGASIPGHREIYRQPPAKP